MKTPAPEPSGRMGEEEFRAACVMAAMVVQTAGDNDALIAEARRARAAETWLNDSLILNNKSARASEDALLLKYDALHDQRHEEARKRDALAKRVREMETALDAVQRTTDLDEIERVAAAALDAGKP